MAVYHQMGHNGENLLNDKSLIGYAGAILSPVNYGISRITSQIKSLQTPAFEFIFDPQLYYPNSQRGQLNDWPYFPSEVDTADISSKAWWNAFNKNLIIDLQQILPKSVCSPAVVPKVFTDDYALKTVDICSDLIKKLYGSSIDVIQTVIVRFSDLSQPDYAHHISSIYSNTKANRIYVIFLTDINPRRELTDDASLNGCIRFIRLLEKAGLKTIIGYCSTDIVLWKFAGASSCATGKFFNLRRFSPARWQEPQEGGGVIAYWTEPSLLAYLRDADIDRLLRAKLLPASSITTEPSKKIMNIKKDTPGSPWLKYSWRQYMKWFHDFDDNFISLYSDTDAFLKQIENNWQAVEKARILMDEEPNDGSWIRRWRQAVRG